MALITPTELKTHITTTLTDAALQRIIDAEEQAIVERFGANTSQVEEIEESPTSQVIYLKRSATSITTVVETTVSKDAFFESIASSSVTLSADDYELLPDNRSLRRLDDGTNPRTRWGERVKVTYAPEATDKRIMVLIDLCKLHLAYNGPISETIGGGEYRSDIVSYKTQREEILNMMESSKRSYA